DGVERPAKSLAVIDHTARDSRPCNRADALGSFEPPALLARPWIVAVKLVCPGHEHLVTALEVIDYWCCVGIAFLSSGWRHPLRFPSQFAGLPVVGHDVARGFLSP